jgi:Tol biopolymer transport system component
LGLTGRLVVTLGNQGIQEVDLGTGEVRLAFLPPDEGWMTAADRSPDGRWLALAYAPPPADGEVQLGYTSIYLLPGDCASRPQACTAEDLTLAVERADPHEAYFSPLWAPDGASLYFAHFTPSDSETSAAFMYTLERVPMADGDATGAPEVVLEDGLWPAISPDGTQMVYVYSDPDDYTNHLRLVSISDSEQRELIGPDSFDALDAPFFSLDGSQVFFSAVGDGPAVSASAPVARLPRWLEWLMGAREAQAAGEARPAAHNVPSDWWVMPASGGTPTRLTQVYDTGMFGDISPAGEYIAYISASGLYVMRTDGSDLQRLLDLSGFGTLEWVE